MGAFLPALTSYLKLSIVDRNLFMGRFFSLLLRLICVQLGAPGYSVQLNSLGVFNSTITSAATQAILDSGTNVLLLPSQPFTDLKRAFRRCCGVEWSGVEWSGVEWSGVEWSGVEWSGVEWSGVE